MKTHSEHSNSRWRFRRSGDSGRIAEIAERLRTSQEQHAIKRDRHIRKAHRTLELETEISKIRRSRNHCRDHGTVANITRAARYKKWSTHKEGTR
ncbi:LOW QUALITY PROTEIN: hypothetical protein HID58_087304 [Brassica napus]|uniref:Uncharacterized protein n=1 Tax=Brassica napus TaxID=3708 RepID=A0ABQ7XSY0_BRANA|nr:LOW QUALITY PROTEIN: hypothetical protein HID58_087304 [Brassica napus]